MQFCRGEHNHPPKVVATIGRMKMRAYEESTTPPLVGTWTLDSGLDYGLDYGLNWTVNSVLDPPFKCLTYLEYATNTTTTTLKKTLNAGLPNK